MPTPVELSIYRTLAYFDYFKYPLTSFEIWKWLLEPAEQTSLAQIVEVLHTSTWLKTRLDKHHGFYGLGQVSDWVADRHLRFLDASRKYRKVAKAIKLYRHLPGVEGVAVCNSLAWYQTKDTSDIDLFVVSEPGQLWSVRMLTTAPVILTRQRPGESQVDPVCLSFFCASSAMNLESLKIGASDPYLAYWSYSLVPVHDRSGWLTTFKENNQWLKTVLPNAYEVRRAHRFALRTGWRLPGMKFFEKMAKRLQLNRFPKRIHAMMNMDTRVVVNDDILKFHDDDGRAEIALTLQDKLSRV